MDSEVKTDADVKRHGGENSESVMLRHVRIDAVPDLDVLIENGRIRRIGKGLGPVPAVREMDCGGSLLLPSFLDAHVHLDKTRFGGPRLRHEPTSTVAQRIANEVRLRSELRHDPLLFGSSLVRQLIVKGTTHLRSHVDVDASIGLRHVEAMLTLRELFARSVDIQLVAFPQSGLAAPGVAGLLREALRMGVDVIGGLDPHTIDNDREGALDTLFDLAETTGAPLDIHLHEPGEIGLATIRSLIDRVGAHGMQGRVNISHGYALGQVSREELDEVLPQLAELGISVATSAPGAVTFPNVDDLVAAGVTYMGVSDNIQDMWSPWGNGDQLERAMFLAYRSGYRADPLLRRCFDMVTKAPARLFGLAGHGLTGIKEGAPANLTAVKAPDVESAVLHRPGRLFTMKDGVFTALHGTCLV